MNLQERVTFLEGHKHTQQIAQAVDLTGVNGEIASIREFYLLLRHRQIGLENRVAVLEARDPSDIDELTRRVDIIEEKLFEFTGSLRLSYNVRRHTIFTNSLNIDPNDARFVVNNNGTPNDESDDFLVQDPNGKFFYDRFDIDRIFGEGLKRDMPIHGGHSIFSTGVADDDDEDDFERVTDFNGPREGKVNANLDLGFGFAKGKGGCGFPRKLDCFGGSITLELDQLEGVDTDDDDLLPDPFVYAFNFKQAQLHYGTIGGEEHLKFEFGRDLDIDFTGYVVDTGDSDEDDDEDDEDDFDNFEDLSSGFAAYFDASDYLETINPKLVFFYGTDPKLERSNATYAWGARAQVTLLEGVTIGGSFARRSENASDFEDELDNNIGLTVFGIDGQANIGIFNLDFEFANETLDLGTNVATTPGSRGETVQNNLGLKNEESHSLFFALLSVNPEDSGALSLNSNIRIKSIETGYRNLPLNWNGINSDFDTQLGAGDLSEDQIGEESELDLDQRGFGLKASAQLFLFDIDGYFDTYDIENGIIGPDRIRTTAFGIEGDINVFSSIAITGFFRSVNISDSNGNSAVVDSTEEDNAFPQDSNTLFITVDSTRDDAFYVDREFWSDDQDYYTTGFGVGLKHSGRGEDALVKDLNVDFIFGRINAGYDTTVINLDVDYRLNIGPFDLKPYFGFQNINNGGSEDDDGMNDDNPDENLADYTRLRVGTSLNSKPIDIIFKPSLLGAVNLYSKDFRFDNDDTNRDNDYTATAFQFSVGVKLNEFLFENSAFTVKYGFYQGENIDVPDNAPNTSRPDDGNAPDPDRASNRNDDARLVHGLEVIWNYYDLELAYGLFSYDPSTDIGSNSSQGQAFRIKYKIDF